MSVLLAAGFCSIACLMSSVFCYEEDAKVFCQKALKYDLILVPGDSFGAPGYFRMAYCIETQKVERSLKALRKFVETEYPDRAAK